MGSQQHQQLQNMALRGVVIASSHPPSSSKASHVGLAALQQLQYLAPAPVGQQAAQAAAMRPNRNNEQKKRCQCKRTKCLKLYCPCFAAGLYCGEKCNCFDCRNDQQFYQLVVEARDKVKHKTPDAFIPKVRVSTFTRTYQAAHGQEAPQVMSPPQQQAYSSVPTLQHQKGCRCTRTSASRDTASALPPMFIADPSA